MNRISIIFSALIFIAVACSDNENNMIPTISPQAQGIFTDEDGREYGWVTYAGLDWMTENLKREATEGLYEAHPTEAVLNGEPDDMLELYGYLYDYNAALSAVPQGWRLPTDDDWKKLEKALGISDAELDNTEWRGNYAGELIRQKEGGSGLSFIYSGYYTGSSTSYTSKFRLLGISGYYWSSTSDESRTGDAYIFYRKITYNSSQICRYSSIKDNRFSVRCVRDHLSN